MGPRVMLRQRPGKGEQMVLVGQEASRPRFSRR